jgi:hypothetical protein
MKDKRATLAVAIPASWRHFQVAEAVASVCASAAYYRSLEDRRIVPMIVAELKFRDVKRQIFLDDIVESRSHRAWRSTRSLQSLGMNCTSA